MIINHNMASLNAWRNLQNTNTQLNTSLERLSSGLRINRAADDAAGLAISEKMTAQINGLTQAISNAQNGISLLQTAEGALGTSESILQRMRQLSMGSAADSASASDRQQNQKEMDQLAQELSRISNTTEFNTKNLLGGAFQNQSFQIGANAGQNVQFSIGAMDAATLGVTAQQGITIADGNVFSSASLAANATATTQAYQVTGNVTAAATATATPAAQAATSAVYTVTLTGTANTLTLTAATPGTSANGFTLVTDTAAGINNPNVTMSGSTITLHLSTTAANNTDTLIKTAFAGAQAQTGLTVSGTVSSTAVTAASMATTTTAIDNAGISFSAVGPGASGNGTTIHWVTGQASTSASITGSTVTINVKTGGDSVTNILSAVNNSATVGTVVKASSTTTGSVVWNSAPADVTTSGGADASATYNLLDANGNSVQAGATASAGTVSFTSGLKLNVNSTVLNSLPAGALATQTIDVVTANSSAAVAGTAGVLNSQATVGKGILIDTQANASSALTAIDAAINKVSTARATLGALQNRLNSTVSNLGTTSDNMTAAESRIRDADMALEMANFTRQQILMQAGTAMLAQANQVPQSTLKLLQ